MHRIQRRVLVSGQVQGVFFRQTTLHLARDLGLSGWVRNRRDGRVEAVFQGPPDAVERMVAWCRLSAADSVVERPRCARCGHDRCDAVDNRGARLCSA
jgi:acylphosphatase